MSTIYAELSIYGVDLQPTFITEMLGLQPTMTWVRGETRNVRTGAVYEGGCWKTQTTENDKPLEQHFAILIAICENCVDALRRLQTEFEYDIEVSVVAHCGDGYPDLSLNPEMIHWLATIKASLDLDFYP